MRFLAILTLKNEAAFVLDWLAHHRACGFTDFLIFTNDCTDGTDLMLDRLQDLGLVVHVRNEGPFPEGPQWAALKAADRHPLRSLADWYLVCDIDEYVNVHVGDHRISDLLAALPEATAIPLTWRMFGNAGVVAYEDRPLTEVFTRAAPAILHWPWRASLFKTLLRNDGSYAKLGVHRPRSPDKLRIGTQRWFDGSGREMPSAFHTQGLISPPGQDNFRLAQLNHYALGAMESYLLKCDRGRANRDSAAFDMGYWVDRNFSDVEDRSVLALHEEAMALRAGMMADPQIARLHQAGVCWRHERFAALMTEEPWRALFGRLLMAPPSRVLSSEDVKLIRR